MSSNPDATDLSAVPTKELIKEVIQRGPTVIVLGAFANDAAEAGSGYGYSAAFEGCRHQAVGMLRTFEASLLADHVNDESDQEEL